MVVGAAIRNLNGALRACQSFYEPLKASGRGRIINIASLGSFVGISRSGGVLRRQDRDCFR